MIFQLNPLVKAEQFWTEVFSDQIKPFAVNQEFKERFVLKFIFLLEKFWTIKTLMQGSNSTYFQKNNFVQV